MDETDLSWQIFVDESAAKVVEVEQRVSKEQLEYLRQFYAMNRSATSIEIGELTKQLFIDDFNFYVDLMDWFFGQRLAEQELILHRCRAIKVAA